MAAIAIPLITTLAPSIIQLIAGLVHKEAPAAEARYGAGTGPVKFSDVFSAVIQQLQAAATTGAIPKELPSDEAIKMVIQAVVSSMNLQGQLQPVQESLSPLNLCQTQIIKVTAGQSVTIVGI